jgi:potassium-transporting ATPase KdpC subunit
MMKQLRAALVSLVVLTVITGLLYPLAVTVLAQALFPYQANGGTLPVSGERQPDHTKRHGRRLRTHRPEL